MVEKELHDLIKQIQARGCEEQTTKVKAAHGGCPEKLYDTISSFSNQNSGGTFVFGLDEKRNFEKVGVYDAQDLQKKVMEYCEQMTPVVRPVFTVCDEDGMVFVSAEIPPVDITERPCFKTARGRLHGSYIRVGDADKPMTEYEVYSYEAFRKKYRDDIRCFLKGDSGMARNAVIRITGSQDLYNPDRRGNNASVNFITCHDGFTLYDLYAYNEKHNEKNGWNNTDGDNGNNSWNCGIEGETDDPTVLSLRKRLRKNAFAVLMCSRGAAMFLAGDEFCNTQFGNNNAYCQDNITSWLDWSRLEKYSDMFEFCRFMINFRMTHNVIRRKTSQALCGYPDISVHNGSAWNENFSHDTRLVGVMYSGRTTDDTDDDMVLILINTFWENQTMRLPDLPQNFSWNVAVDTWFDHEEGTDYNQLTERYDSNIVIKPRSVIILNSKRNDLAVREEQ